MVTGEHTVRVQNFKQPKFQTAFYGSRVITFVQLKALTAKAVSTSASPKYPLFTPYLDISKLTPRTLPSLTKKSQKTLIPKKLKETI